MCTSNLNDSASSFEYDLNIGVTGRKFEHLPASNMNQLNVFCEIFHKIHFSMIILLSNEF